MNLDELKKGWGVLNERLSQNEVISQRIIKEMILRKTNAAYDSIYRASKWSLMVIFLLGGLLLPFAKMQGMPIYRETFIAMETFIFLGFLFEGYMFYLLSRFNLNTMKVDEAMRSMLKYKKMYINNQRCAKYGALLIIIVCMGLQNAFTPLVIALTILFTLIAFFLGYTQDKRLRQSLQEIEDGLRELKEYE
ncbi:MAG: hypothetical protein J6R28_07315 [Bacteroides sp.]|nr:hypothetical protein [Bacteroides sp.]